MKRIGSLDLIDRARLVTIGYGRPIRATAPAAVGWGGALSTSAWPYNNHHSAAPLYATKVCLPNDERRHLPVHVGRKYGAHFSFNL